jgi:predicted metal-dependent hydrolase
VETNNHQIHSTRNLDPIELDDVYIDTRTFTKTSNNKSPKAKAYHTLAIEAALTALEKDATNSDIYKWIKNEAEDSSEEHKSYMNYLDFEGDSITPFSTASQQAVILLSNDRPITKKSFQNACSKAKKP